MIWSPRPDWHDQARCKGYPSEIFYGFDGEQERTRRRRLAIVAELCAACPVSDQCREAGRTEAFGYWGGTTEEERFATGTAPRSNPSAARRAERLGLDIAPVEARPGPDPKPIEHGTRRGWRTHLRRGEEPCWSCRDAKARYAKAIDEQKGVTNHHARRAAS